MEKTVTQVHRSKQDARENYNRLSRWYDLIAGSSEARFRNIGVELVDLQPGERLLEIGFGTGQCLISFAESAGMDGWVCGIDLSDGMASIAGVKLKKHGLSNRSGLILGDAARLPINSGRFHAVFMSFTLELFDTREIPDVLGEIRRVLKSKGRLVVVSLVKGSPPTFMEKMYEWFHQQMPILVDCRPIFVRSALQAAGFTINRVIDEKMWGLPVAVIAASMG
jgi:demethylmenaquinone methyltransferase/2-methoxy-6-polyprenyl-1,4-benzoquinol methylase